MASGKMSLLDWYDQQMGARPYFTNSWSTATVSVITTFLRHAILVGKGVPEGRDITNQAVLGGFLIGPVATTWFANMDRIFFPGWDDSLKSAIAKALCENMIFSPFMNTSYMFCFGILEGRPLADIKHEICSKFVEIQKGNLYCWFPAAIISYKLVPPKFRVLFARMVSILWMLWLITKTKADEKKEKKA
eukprot:gnl/MRDRNA2_/MRDRNA2_136499_c0_seq1.p1 gnl/MRDRNA2_/MRDRNA2_136499_c0~~gnl/MRDRNA2_/MRDRNA2_136499_c0_seq1.p1  ORF type:complete len:190 (-),score=30.66 gnl/MRDRNA2_/MRDRNA2_136499_c0_seq1:10-579(-)